MRHILIAVALLSAEAPARAAPDAGGPFRTLLGTLVRGRCMMDTCEWFSIESADVEKRSRDATLMKVRVKYWASDHPHGDYDRRRPRKFESEDSDYLLCSRRTPSIIKSTEDGPWTSFALSPGSPWETGGMFENATALYWAACEGSGVEDLEKAAPRAVRLGYAAHIPEPVASTKLARPADAIGDPTD